MDAVVSLLMVGALIVVALCSGWASAVDQRAIDARESISENPSESWKIAVFKAKLEKAGGN